MRQDLVFNLIEYTAEGVWDILFDYPLSFSYIIYFCVRLLITENCTIHCLTMELVIYYFTLMEMYNI